MKQPIIDLTGRTRFHSLKVDKLILPNNVLLAPLAGITDYPFRRIAQSFGPGLTVTEMVSAQAVCMSNKKTLKMASPGPGEGLLSVQIFGSDPAIMKEAALICQGLGAGIIDVNMGCPQKKVIRSGSGAALMKEPRLAASIVSSIASSVDVPVTVKIRLGWDKELLNAPEFSRLLEGAGASLIVVHARTRSQMFGGKADWSAVRAVKEAVNVPVIANGDIKQVEDARMCLEISGADGIMIGRAALGRPWFFRQVADYLSGDSQIFLPSLNAISRLIDRHLGLIEEYYEEPVGTWMARKHLAWYTKGLRYSAAFRDMIYRVKGVDQLARLKDKFFTTLAQPPVATKS